MNIKLTQKLYIKYVKPRSNDEDQARREYVFNILVLGFWALTTAAFLLSLIHFILDNNHQNVAPWILLIPVVGLGWLYRLSRKSFANYLVYIFSGVYFSLGVYALHTYSVNLSQGLLTCGLAIAIAGFLISSRAAIVMTALTIGAIILLTYLQATGVTQPYIAELDEPYTIKNAIVLCGIFCVIMLIAWLATSEIEISLKRARISEAALRRERNSLEAKVRLRTKELEAAQLEKTRELYRFAEFGRLSSSLIHDLADPLTAVSLSFGQIEYGAQPETTGHIRASITHMEHYVESARRQLRSQSDVKPFDSKDEVEKVINFQSSRARTAKVKVCKKLATNTIIVGDSAKFSQVISNLIGNAIDSYGGTDIKKPRKIWIDTSQSNGRFHISVRDIGSGISQSDIKRIFDPFFSTKSSDRGTGIGLTITQRIVEDDFKGKLHVESTKQTGTTFTVELPLN